MPIHSEMPTCAAVHIAFGAFAASGVCLETLAVWRAGSWAQV